MAETAEKVGPDPAPDALLETRRVVGQPIALLHTGRSLCTQDVYAEQFTMPARHLYAAPHLLVAQQVVRLNLVQNSFMRPPGETPGTFALESALDELAHRLGQDPVALRRRNEPARDPTHNTPFSSRFLNEAYVLGAQKFGCNPRRPVPGTTQDGDWLVGTGVASAYYPTQELPATVRGRLAADGSVTAYTSSVEMGSGRPRCRPSSWPRGLGCPSRGPVTCRATRTCRRGR